ncbi:hypothetical protein A2412_03175 [Candidatus Peribacteria bacterium RIFOXYC1_FULL_58_8]|nr:MAG: hypothetical protein A2412_03175 [Candidatus Peribacteria bacterium RIFOXYC1_FULL_58_8]
MVLITILLMMLALERRKIVFAVLGGALLGALVGVYLWSWMIAWSYVGALFVWEAIAWWRMRPRQSIRHSRFGMLLLLISVGLVVAGFFAVRILHLMQHPLYEQVAFRQGMYLMRRPESWVYSILFLGMSLGLLMAAWRFPKLRGSHRYAILVPVAVWIGMHQQLLHGHVIAFVSHFTFAIALGAVCSLLLGSLFFSRRLVIPFLCGAVMLSGTTWDNRHVYKQFVINHTHFTEQHFVTLLPVLDRLPRSVILSDESTSGFVSIETHHDILTSIYLESALMPHEEIARRYCITQGPLTNEQRRIPEQIHLVWPDANAANRGTDAREREVALVERECAAVDADPGAALKQYGVQYVLWDVRRKPEWDVKRLKVPLTKVEEDAGNWVLFSVNGARP